MDGGDGNGARENNASLLRTVFGTVRRHRNLKMMVREGDVCFLVDILIGRGSILVVICSIVVLIASTVLLQLYI